MCIRDRQCAAAWPEQKEACKPWRVPEQQVRLLVIATPELYNAKGAQHIKQLQGKPVVGLPWVRRE
eukprot:10871733-Prorocentrum_lima.AAC.1